jgi:hypothetical protein
MSFSALQRNGLSSVFNHFALGYCQSLAATAHMKHCLVHTSVMAIVKPESVWCKEHCMLSPARGFLIEKPTEQASVTPFSNDSTPPS